VNITDLLARLKRLDIKIWLDGDQIKLNAPDGVLTSDIQAEIIASKNEIRSFLRKAQTAARVSHTIIPAGQRDEFPLSFAQQRLWFLDQYDPNSTAYSLINVFELNGTLNFQALENSITEILRRHNALRTVFRLNGSDQPVQIILPPGPFSLNMVDLQMTPAEHREDNARESIAAMTAEQYNLKEGPLFFVKLLRMDENRHWLVLNCHHIICDGWSIGIFLYELKVLYRAFSAEEPLPLEPLAIQYSDYSVWQRQSEVAQLLHEKLDFWLETLKGPLPILELPTDAPHPVIQTFHGAYDRIQIPQTLIDRLINFCDHHDITQFMLMLGAFQILLYRYTGIEDLIVGIPYANRLQSEIEPIIGLFINALPIRISLAGDPTGLELLSQVRDSALQAFEHQEVPFEMIVAKLQPERDTSHSPIYQVLFIFQEFPERPVKSCALEFKTIPFESQTAKFDLTLEIIKDQGNTFCGFEYNTDLFKPETIQRFAKHYLMILDSLCARPDLPVAHLPLLTPEELRRVLYDWNATDLDYPYELTLADLFERQAARSPETTAICDEQAQITYGELDKRANQMAHYLRSLGVGPGTLVGVSLPRCIDLVIGLLGILKAGGAYVPLDPSYPVDRLEFMLKDSQAPLLITYSDLAPRFAGTACQILCLNIEHNLLSEQSNQPLTLRSGPDDLAYVIYTSGSTGRPKGVQILMCSLVNLLTSMLEQPGLSSSDIMLSITNLSFDIAGLELYLPLICGGRLVLVTHTTAGDGSKLIKALERSGATCMQATPTTWKMLVAAGWHGNSNLKALCGGEPLASNLASDLLQRCGSLWNMYGPTETTIWSTICRVTRTEDAITIGRPIANTQVYLLDKKGLPVPIGVPGELTIGGNGVARGYLNQPELTAEKFIPDMFRKQPGARLYRTGDLARFLPDGRILFIGREDSQIKLHGVRIELGEISTNLLEHPGIESAVVIGRKENRDNPYLTAYIAPKPQTTLREEELRYFLSERLPTAMIPTRFVFIDKLPLTPNGKVDIKALPVPPECPDETANCTEPRNAVEAKLIQIWKNLLANQHVGVYDDFFQLGGHSLLAVQMFNQIDETFGVRLPLTSLFHKPTVDHLAGLIYQYQGSFPWSSLVEIKPSGSKPPFFCVHGITGDVLWFGWLARYMDPEQPIWGLESPGLDGIRQPVTTIEEMSRLYIQEIKSIQPEGPYHLCGYSFGGTVIFEVAHQLEVLGDKIGLLVIIDHATPKSDYYTHQFSPGYVRLFLQNLPYRVIDLLLLRPDEIYSRIQRKLSHILKTVTGRGKKNGSAEMDAEDLIDGASTLPAHVQEIIKINYRAIHEYTPLRYHGVLTLVRVRSSPFFVSHDPEMGWGKFADKVDIHIVPGSHLALFREPNIQTLAKQLQTCLDEAQ